MLAFNWKFALLLVVGIGAAASSSVAVTAMLAVLAFWALLGPMQVIQSLALGTLINYLNPVLVPAGSSSGILVRLILLVAALRILPTVRSEQARLLWPAWLFAIAAALLSIGSSSNVAISETKVLIFTVAVTTVLTAYTTITPVQVTHLRKWFGTLFIVVIVLSFFTLAQPSIAFARNGTGMQGVLSHPQSLAIFLAPFAAWLIANLLLLKGTFRWPDITLVLLTMVLLFLSEARTSIVCITIATLTALTTRIISTRQTFVGASAGKISGILVAVFFGIIFAALASSKIYDAAIKFAFKRTDAADVGEAFYQSRGGGIASQWQNFIEQPLQGHGFGVYAKGPPSASLVEFAGIPISAPVEKGFVFTAILEETGIIGGLLFLLMIVHFARQAWRNADLRWIAMFVACIAVNIGEAILVSPGGIGMMIWLFIGLCLVEQTDKDSGLIGEHISVAPVAAPSRFSNLMRRVVIATPARTFFTHRAIHLC